MPQDAGGARQGVPPRAFRDALALWASGVTVVAVRDDARVYATTATSFAAVSAEPPLVLVSLGPGAQVLPFLDPGRSFVVNILSAGQRRVATVHADPYPVGPSPFPAEGAPRLPGALVALTCTVEQVLPVAGGVRLVLGLVEEVSPGGEGDRPLLHHGREYRSLD